MDRSKIVSRLGSDAVARLTPQDLDGFIAAFGKAFSPGRSRPDRCAILITLVNLMLVHDISIDTLDIKSRVETFLKDNFKYTDRYASATPESKAKMRMPDIEPTQMYKLMALAGFTGNYLRTKYEISSLACPDLI